MTEVLLLSGSTRGASTNSAALRTVAADAPEDVRAVTVDLLSELPAFNPDDDHGDPPAPVRRLREAIGRADVVVICTPEYAGTLPGSFKNLLDWTVGGGELDGKAAAWLNVAQPGRGEGAIATLETVLGYVNARLLSSACGRVYVGRDALGGDGLVADVETRRQLRDFLSGVVDALADGPASDG
jgi:chromate reductase, NAD(P)H dehydrogenase (quinone)